MKRFFSLFMLFFLFLLFAKADKTELLNAATKKYDYVLSIQKKIANLVERAKKEQDIKWKLCLDDTYATIKGIVASVKSSKERIEDLLKLEKLAAAQSQMVIIDGLVDSANKIYGDANSCPRQLTKINTNLEINKEEDVDKVGYGSTLDDVMGNTFAKGFETLPSDISNTDDTGGADTNPISIEPSDVAIPVDNYASPS